MSRKCKKCKTNPCCCEESACDTSCLGCTHKHSSECITLESTLDCIDSAVGTPLTEVLEEFCAEIKIIQDNIDTIEESIEDIQEDIETINSNITNLTASDISITALDCVGESDVTGTVQSVLEDICVALADLADGVVDPDADWFISGTTDVPTAITDEIYTLGKVGIGLDTPVTTLDVLGNLSVENTNNAKLYVDSNLTVSALLTSNIDYLLGLVDGDTSVSAFYGKENFASIVVHYTNIAGNSLMTFDKTATDPFVAITVDDEVANAITFQVDTDNVHINYGVTEIAKFDNDNTARNTRFLIYDVDNATMERVSVGEPDSGGAGFKLLRIPN